MAKSIARIIIGRTAGFVFFLLLLALLNAFSSPGILSGFAAFLNSNLLLFFAMYALGLLSDIFWSFSFPMNLAAPPISAIFSLFVVRFFFRVLSLTTFSGIAFSLSEIIVQAIVFCFTLFIGYLLILIRGGLPREEWMFERHERLNELRERRARQPRKGKAIDWADVGEEFKLALYHLGKSLADAFEPKKRKKK